METSRRRGFPLAISLGDWLMRCLALLAASALLVACADSVTPVPDATVRTDVLSEAPEEIVTEDVPGAPTCSAALGSCRSDRDCPSDCQRFCTSWSSRFVVPYINGGTVCFSGYRAECATAYESGPLCSPGFLCVHEMMALGGSSGCVQARDCLTYQRAFEARLPATSPREQRCQYTDGTLAVDGRPRAARCVVGDGFQSCGLDCGDCPIGQACFWPSERYATGICVPHPFPVSRGESGAPCALDSLQSACSRDDEACVHPVRHDVDGVMDSRRPGVCMPVATCRAIAAMLPDGYACEERRR